MIKQLVSFYKRRIFIPVNKNDLVLDVGSGDKPHWRSDVLLDKYIDDEYGSQRSGSKKLLLVGRFLTQMQTICLLVIRFLIL